MSGNSTDWLKVVARLNHERRYPESLEIIRAEVAAGSQAAKVHLAMLHREAGLSREDADRIIDEVEAAMDAADADAHWLLSRAYELMLGEIRPEEKPKRSFEHLVASARLSGSPIDAYAVAEHYRHGSASNAVNLVEAERWLEEAAKRGHPDAARELRRK